MLSSSSGIIAQLHYRVNVMEIHNYIWLQLNLQMQGWSESYTSDDISQCTELFKELAGV